MVSETIGESKIISTTEGQGYLIGQHNMPNVKIAENIYEGERRMVSEA